MLDFESVSGPCLVDDRASCRDAQPGLSLPLGGKAYIIVTGPGSRAELSVSGEAISMGPSSVLRVGVGPAGRPVRASGLNSADLKLFLGKLWAAVDRSTSLEDAVNATIGVRG